MDAWIAESGSSVRPSIAVCDARKQIDLFLFGFRLAFGLGVECEVRHFGKRLTATINLDGQR